MGCPVNRITKVGAGASLMCQVDRTVQLARSVVEAVRIPVTVKMRLGWDRTQLTAPTFAREFEQVGVAAVAIHGRTREQGFSGLVDRTGIRRVVEAVQRIPVIGNGDIRTVSDGERMFAETGCHGISMGRGVLANPWLFGQFVEWERTGQFSVPGTFDDRLRLLKRQFAYVEQQRGIERAITSFRKMAHWYLKAMCVAADLRDQMQKARTQSEFEAALDRVCERGPARGSRTGLLPEFSVPVPAGPNANW